MTNGWDEEAFLRKYGHNKDGTKMYGDDGLLIDYSESIKQKAQEKEERRQDTKRWRNPMSAWVARELTKPVYKGAMSVPDLPVALNNLILSGINKFGGTNIEHMDYPSDIAGEAVDYMTDGLSVGSGKSGVVSKGVEFGASMLGGGAVAQGLKAALPASKAISKAAPWLGSTEKGQVGSAAAMGAVTQGAEDLGFDPMVATGIGLGAGVGLASKNIKNAGRFNTKAYDAAQQEGLDLPRIAFDKSRSTKIANTVAEHSLFSGSKLKEQAANTNLSFKKAFERNLDKNTVPDTLTNMNKKDALYELSEKALTDHDLIAPKNTLKGLKDAQKAIHDNGSIVGTAKTNQYLKHFDKLSDATMELQLKEAMRNKGQIVDVVDGIPVKKLIEQKKILNNQISKLPQEEWLLKQEMQKVRDAVKGDINDYAVKYPEFGAKWHKAEKMHGDMAKRVEANEMLGIKKQIRPDIRFNPEAIAENYLNVRTNKDFIKIIGGQENLQNFDSIVTAVQSMPTSRVSELATNMKIMGAIGTSAGGVGAIATGATGALTGFAGAAGSILGGDIIAHMLIKKGKGLATLAAFAKTHTPENAKKIKNYYKAQFGMTVKEVNNVLMEELKKIDKEKQK